MSDDVIAARQRVQKALDHLDPGLARMAVDVCCHLKGLTEIEKERGWPARSAKVVLVLALESLAVHYGFSPGRH